MEVGSVATPFEHESFGQTLAKCQRYFEKSAPSTSSLIDTSQGYVNVRDGTASTLPRYYHRKYSVEKRATPTITLYDALGATGKVRVDSTNGIAGVVFGSASTAFNLYASTSISHYGIFYGWYSDAEL